MYRLNKEIARVCVRLNDEGAPSDSFELSTVRKSQVAALSTRKKQSLLCSVLQLLLFDSRGN